MSWKGSAWLAAAALGISGCVVPWPHRAPRVSEISGTVASCGAPVADAEVWWAERDARPPCAPATEPVRSDAEGRYRLSGERVRRWGYVLAPSPLSGWDLCVRPPGSGRVHGFRVRFLGPRGAPETARLHLELQSPDFLVATGD